MASSYTAIGRLEKMAAGENDTTWGTKLNTVIDLIEDMIAGEAAISVTTANVTLSTANSSADEARCFAVKASGTLTGDRSVICPAATKFYLVYNGCSGAYDLTFKTSGGTGVVIPQGTRMLVWCDGTNVVKVAAANDNYLWCGTSSGTNTITIGGTPAATAYTTGMMIAFVAGGDNDDAVTANLDSLGAKAVEKRGAALIEGDIVTGDIVLAIYDGTAFQIVSQPGVPEVSDAKAFLNSLSKTNGNFAYFDPSATDEPQLTVVLSSSHGDDEGVWIPMSNCYWDEANSQWSRISETVTAFAMHVGPIAGEGGTLGFTIWRARPSSEAANPQSPTRLISPTFAEVGGWESLFGATEYATLWSGGTVIELDGSGSTHGYGRFIFVNTTGTTWRLGVMWNSFALQDDTDTTGDASMFKGIEFDTSSGAVYTVESYAPATSGAPVFVDFYKTRVDNFDMTKISSGMFVKGPTTTYSATLTGGAKSAVTHYLNGEPDFFKIVLVCQATDLGYSASDRVAMVGTNIQSDSGGTTITGTGITFVLGSTTYTPIMSIAFKLPNKSTAVMDEITASKWNLEITPFRLAAD